MADETMYFESPNGFIRQLDNVSGSGVFTMWGMSGRFMPGFRFDTQPLGLLEGVEITGVEVQPRSIQIPVRIEGLTREELEENLASLSFEFAPTDGDGRLYVTTVSDKTFYLNCRYSKGMELQEDSEFGMFGANAALEFFAGDPYWYSPSPISAYAAAVSVGKPFFSDPWFPVEFTSSQVLDNFEIINPGVATWPIITITGPTDSVAIVNKLTGETIWIDTGIADGQTLEIDTRPKQKTILLDHLTNYYSYRRVGSVMFPLQRGLNRLRVELLNADENTSITVAAYPRFWVPR